MAFADTSVFTHFLRMGDFLARSCLGEEENDDRSTLALAFNAANPPYRSTTVDSLESRRRILTLALFGQLSVVTCRLLTGQLGEATMGMLIFVIGNSARCTLRSSSLTVYCSIAGGCGTMDSFELLRHISDITSAFLTSSLGPHHIYNTAQVAGWILAPLAEIGGANVAYHCHLTPDMLFEAQAQAAQAQANTAGTAPTQAYVNMAQALMQMQGVNLTGITWTQTQGQHQQEQQPQQQPQQQHDGNDSIPLQAATDPTTLFGINLSGLWGSSAPSAPSPSDPPAAGSSDPHSNAAHHATVTATEADAAVEATAASASSWQGWGQSFMQQGQAASSSDPAPDGSILCSGCLKQVHVSEGRPGVGEFQSCFYCNTCWNRWTSFSSSKASQRHQSSSQRGEK
eukprot:TRINITY_DN7668_c2_g2_i2.p1 TRINITY_DN7668_c2_g2~~TRINITY_DN7668_c2_g2_i2.p1  ORF type:complete len:399 (-),score=58.87 TRINITY_DN7668_c2_g2_i2:192-1388(-)